MPPPEMEQLIWLISRPPPCGPLATAISPRKHRSEVGLSLLPNQPLATLFLREIRGDYLELL